MEQFLDCKLQEFPLHAALVQPFFAGELNAQRPMEEMKRPMEEMEPIASGEVSEVIEIMLPMMVQPSSLLLSVKGE
jgi:hypothetical protein